MSWVSKPIGAFCRTGSGGTPSRKQESRFYGGLIPWVKSGELKKSIVFETEETITEAALVESSAKIIPPGALLVAMYGATVGRIAILGIEAASNQAVCHIVPDKSVADRQYLFYALHTQVPRWLEQRVGGAQPNISQQIIRDTQIPLPPLEEQRRIAAILDRADAVRRKRQEAIRLTEELLRSFFLDMFGDPVTNPKGWNTDYLGKYILHANNGLSRRRKTIQNVGDIVLRLQDIKVGCISFSEPNRIVLEQLERERYLLVSNDLVFIRVNGNKEYVGRCAVYKGFEENLYHNDHIIRIQTSPDISTEYLAFVFNHPSGKKLLRNQIKTSAGQYTISQKGIESIKLPIPPINLQNDFIKKQRSIEEINNRNQESLLGSQNLFNSLLQRAFRGEL